MKKLDIIYYLFILLVTILVVIAEYRITERRKDCSGRGYAYIQGQCVELRLK